jgi:hypothetical protein
MLGKPYQLAGQLLFLRDYRKGRHARLIEYKTAEVAGKEDGVGEKTATEANGKAKTEAKAQAEAEKEPAGHA